MIRKQSKVDSLNPNIIEVGIGSLKLLEIAENNFAAESIVNSKGRLLIKEGTQFTRTMIESLLRHKNKGILKISTAPQTPKEAEIFHNIGAKMGSSFEELVEKTRQNQEKLKADVVNFVDIQKSKLNLPPELDKIINHLISIFSNESALKEITLFNVLNEDLEHEETVTHSIGVAIRTALFGYFLMTEHREVAQKYELNGWDDLKELACAALFHDIGKAALKKEKLYFKGKTSKEFQAYINTHTELGSKMLSNSSERVRRVALEHHNEASEDNHPFSEIVNIIDDFDALSQKRCYRNGKHPIETLGIQLDKFMNGQYREDLYNLFYQYQLKKPEDILKIKKMVYPLADKKTLEIKSSIELPTENKVERNYYYYIKEIDENHRFARCLVAKRDTKKPNKFITVDDINGKPVLLNIALPDEITKATADDVFQIVVTPSNSRKLVRPSAFQRVATPSKPKELARTG